MSARSFFSTTTRSACWSAAAEPMPSNNTTTIQCKETLRISLRRPLSYVFIDNSIQRSLCFQDVLHRIARCALAAVVVHDHVRFVLHGLTRVSDSDRQSAATHDGEIDDVVADKRHLVGGDT